MFGLEKPLTEEELFQIFPNLTKDNYRNTSDPDINYNCLAWACGDTHNWWQPSGEKFHFWIHTEFSYSIESHIKALKIVGYKELSDSSDFEPDFEKVALYVGNDGLPKHFARQKENGLWTSKLGEKQDIEHDTLEALECDDYGKVKIILKKPRKIINNAEIRKGKADNSQFTKNSIEKTTNVLKRANTKSTDSPKKKNQSQK